MILCTAVWVDMHNPRASTGLTDSSEASRRPSGLFHIPAVTYPQSPAGRWKRGNSVHDASLRPLADVPETLILAIYAPGDCKVENRRIWYF